MQVVVLCVGRSAPTPRPTHTHTHTHTHIHTHTHTHSRHRWYSHSHNHTHTRHPLPTATASLALLSTHHLGLPPYWMLCLFAVVRRDTAADGNVTPDSSDSPVPATTAGTPSHTKGAHRSRASRERAFNKFAMRYLPPYFCGVFADWMLGPYVYEVYTHYGYSMSEIGTLYVVGFVSSLRCVQPSALVVCGKSVACIGRASSLSCARAQSPHLRACARS
jgi:hypothetical protein